MPDVSLGHIGKGTELETRAIMVDEDTRHRSDSFPFAILSIDQALAVARFVREHPEEFPTNVRGCVQKCDLVKAKGKSPVRKINLRGCA